MSEVVRTQRNHAQRLGQVEVIERPGKPLAYAQRALNPVAAGTVLLGDFAQFGAVDPLVWHVSVFVATTNNGSNYWTLELISTAGAVLATLTTSVASVATWTRLTTSTITAPGSSNVVVSLRASVTGAPGNLYVVPELLVGQ